jgi:hypothetical protein
MKLLIIVLFSLSVTLSLFAQHTNFNSQRNWSLNKKEFTFGFGGTNFLGDLGGRSQIGTDYSIADLDFPATSLGAQIGYRFRFRPRWATSTLINAGLLRGSDANTNELIRRSRNLSFRAPFISVSQRIEWLFYTYEQFGARYRVPGLRAKRDRNNQFYFFGGIGLAYFNPQGYVSGNDEWVNLRPLNTEGQGMAGGPEPYKPFTAIVPFGFGMRTGIDKVWRIGLELSYIKTFTDYMDDVSTVYYDPAKLEKVNGADAAYFSNPSYVNQQWFNPGSKRGDKNLDSYLLVNIVFQKNLTYKPTNYKFSRKPKFRGQGRYKF